MILHIHDGTLWLGGSQWGLFDTGEPAPAGGRPPRKFVSAQEKRWREKNRKLRQQVREARRAAARAENELAMVRRPENRELALGAALDYAIRELWKHHPDKQAAVDRVRQLEREV